MQLPDLSLYVHIPWCVRKCPYCDFNSHQKSDQIPEQEYLAALIRDLQRDAALAQGRPLQSIFIGGGTPSLFSGAAIGSLLDAVAAQLSLADDIEITLEANPGTAEAGKFRDFRRAGVTRLSIGVQSFHDQQLQALGRIHSADDAHRAIDMTVAAGFDSFNIDLMHGLPDQGVAAALEDLQQAMSHQPPHLSWYQLTIEPNTAFYSRPPKLPTEEALADITEAGTAALAQGRYRQYEISAYARDDHQCRHNLNYWRFGDYLGIGAGAHSKITDVSAKRVQRYWKRRQPGEYMQQIEPRAGMRELDSNELRGEYLMNTLRLVEGTKVAHFSHYTGLPLSALEPELGQLIERQLLVHEEGVLRATELGLRFLDTVVGEFFQT